MQAMKEMFAKQSEKFAQQNKELSEKMAKQNE